MKNLNLIIVLLTFAALFGCKTSTSNNVQTEEKEIMILIKTNMGDIKIKLYNETPYHRDNFVKLVEQSYYDSLLFHRVIKDFMIQGGDPDSKKASATTALGSGGPGYTLPAEINPDLFHKKGALSAARTGDQANPTRRSSGSQFYIVQGKPLTDAELDFYEQRLFTEFTEAQRQVYKTIGGTPFLDGQYTVFGEVVEGLDIIDKIAATTIGTNDRPTADIVILSMEIIK